MARPIPHRIPPPGAGARRELTLERVEDDEHLLGWRLRRKGGEVVAANVFRPARSKSEGIPEARLLEAGWRVASMPERELVELVRSAALEILDSGGEDPEAVNWSESIALEVVGVLCEAMGRPRPELIG